MIQFSIVTINYNNLKGLIKTFNSVFIQTNLDLQFIVIDGGSTDGSKEYIEQNSDKISYWVSEPDKGVYHAMNKGLKEAISKYCIFLNSGDYFHDSNVLMNVSSLIKDNPSLVYGLIEWEDTKQIWNPKRNLKDYEMAFQSLIPHQGCFFSTEHIKKMGGYKEEYKIISDWGLMLEILRNIKNTQKLDMIVSSCEHQGISSLFEHAIKKERFSYLRKYAFSTLVKGLLFDIKNKWFVL